MESRSKPGAALVAVLVALLGVAAPASASDAAKDAKASPAPPKAPAADIQAESPPFSEGIFPCSACHAKAPDNLKPHPLAFHDEIQEQLKHGPPTRWCLDCHDASKRDFLHLTDGTLVPYTRSYELCGQCHGDKLRDWKLGIHGKRVGSWNGAKTYYLCVNCHNPHRPKFKALKPEPPPVRPEEQAR